MKHRIVYLAPKNDFLAEIAKKSLEKKGFEITVSSDYSSFIEMLEEGAAVSVVDLLHESGWNALRAIKLKKSSSPTRTIALLSEEHHPYRVEGFRIIGDRMLAQPFEVKDLLEVIQELTDMYDFWSTLNLHEIPIRFQSTEEAMDQANNFVGEIFKLTELTFEAQIQFSTVINEAINNAVAHGNKYRRDRCVDLTLILEEARISTIIADEGRGFSWRDAIENAVSKSPEDIVTQRKSSGKLGGIGYLMIYKYSDVIEYNEAGTVVILSKYITPPLEKPEQQEERLL